MKGKLILIVSVLCGLAAFLLSHSWLRRQQQEYLQLRQALRTGQDSIEVVAVTRDLPSGTVLTMSDLGRRTVPKRDFADRAVLANDFARILNKKLLFAMRKESVVEWAYVDVPQIPRSGLAPMIKPGLRAVSISVGGAAAVSGLVQPNDRVDVLGTFTLPSAAHPGEVEMVTLTVLQDVTVMATGPNLARAQTSSPADALSRGATGYSMVTLEVSLREAELLIFAENIHARLALALRHPEDIAYESMLPDVNFEYLEKNVKELNQYRQRTIRHK